LRHSRNHKDNGTARQTQQRERVLQQDAFAGQREGSDLR
jgi:hypothetical protein